MFCQKKSRQVVIEFIWKINGITGLPLCLYLAICLVFGGCNSSDSIDGFASQVRSAILVSQKPDQIDSIKSAYETPASAQPITIAGRIYAESVSPFDAKESCFTLIELPRPGHNHEDPGDCPFCKRELRNAKFAIVKLVDETGKVFQQPADHLLGLKKNQDITVTGLVSAVGETLVLHASKLHLLSHEDSQTLSKSFHHNEADSESIEQKPGSTSDVDSAEGIDQPAQE